jgi:competence protein ComEA
METMIKTKRLLVALLTAIAIAMTVPAWGETPPVDINTASAAELTTINGIGPSKAQAIVEHREANGPFASIDDLESVRGIGTKLLDRLRPQVTVGSAEAQKEKQE